MLRFPARLLLSFFSFSALLWLYPRLLTSSPSLHALLTFSPSLLVHGPASTMTNSQLSVGYFVNWGIYGRKYFPKDVDVSNLSHILYAFADVKSDSGEVFLTDKWSDEDVSQSGNKGNKSEADLNILSRFTTMATHGTTRPVACTETLNSLLC